jgi:hypothetical protein
MQSFFFMNSLLLIQQFFFLFLLFFNALLYLLFQFGYFLADCFFEILTGRKDLMDLVNFFPGDVGAGEVVD